MFKKIPPSVPSMGLNDQPNFITLENVVMNDGRVKKISVVKPISSLQKVDSKEFTLAAQVKAGIPLKEVNSKVLQPSISEEMVENIINPKSEQLEQLEQPEQPVQE